MPAAPYWITPALALVPRPAGGKRVYQQLAAIRRAGIDVLVSMLDLPEARELGLDEEEIAARRAGMGFINFPVMDHSVPSNLDAFDKLLGALDNAIREGKRIGIHCRACIGRSSVLAASLLVRAGLRDDEAWQQISKARGTPVPETAEQREFVQSRVRQTPWHML